MKTAAVNNRRVYPSVVSWCWCGKDAQLLISAGVPKMKPILIFLFTLAIGLVCAESEEEKRAREFLEKLNERSATRNNRVALVNWAYASNITDENLQKQVSDGQW